VAHVLPYGDQGVDTDSDDAGALARVCDAAHAWLAKREVHASAIVDVVLLSTRTQET